MRRKQPDFEPDLGPFGLLILQSVAKELQSPSRRKYAGVRIEFDFWLGRAPTPSERVALSRNVSRLEALGMVFRMPGRRLVLTQAGRRLTENLAGFPAKLTDAELAQIYNAPIDAMFLPEPEEGPKQPGGDTGQEETASPPSPGPTNTSAPDQTDDRHQTE